MNKLLQQGKNIPIKVFRAQVITSKVLKRKYVIRDMLGIMRCKMLLQILPRKQLKLL